jgi:nucleoside-diphosphate-sugar epimerase
LKILVTGGGGFLGGALCARLAGDGHEVRSFSRGDYPGLRDLGVDHRRGALDDADAVSAAVQGSDAVLHAAALPGIWGSRDRYFRTNVLGTQYVLDACLAHGVRRLVFTSSPSVIHGKDNLEGVDESHPYPACHLAHYPATKAEAERRVMAANGAELATVSLRPHLIWGPGDNHLLPRLASRARAGRLKIVGHAPNKVDTVYIDNAVDAHLAALERLQPGSAIGGKTYFISQDEPIAQADFMNRMLAAVGVEPVTQHIPAGVAYAVGATLELAYGLLNITREPMMTRFLAVQLSTAHWYDISAAKRDLGYTPRVSIDDGMARIRAAYEAGELEA